MSIEIEELLPDARSLVPSAFAARHAAAFLVRSSSDGDLESPEETWNDRTNPMAGRSTNYSLPRLTFQMSRAPSSAFYVYPLRKQRPDQTPAPITLGRSLKRDVRIDDLSVSNLHAYVIVDESGGFQILDKASRNGTRIDGDLLKPGARRVLSQGATVELGRVRTTFMPAAQLIDFILDILNGCRTCRACSRARSS